MGGLIVMLLLGAAAPGQAQAEDSVGALAMPVAESPTMGPADALVTIVEFSEFQCPFCGRVGPTLKRIRQEYPDQVRIAFKHNPLPFHKDAWPAATASIAAQEQGKFWEMHDKLFDNRRKLKREDLDGYAMELGLNMAKFAKAMDSAPYDKRIKAEQALAAKFGARGTPAFFVNGIKLMGAQPFPKFKELIDAELKAAGALKAQGLKAADIYAKRCAANLKLGAAPGLGVGGAPVRAVASKERFRVPVGEAYTRGGGADAEVTIIESSDFQCPFCSRVGPTIKKIQEEYGDKVRLAFKHNPLSFHKRAFDAALAAEAAGRQGKFWEMHHVMFANQRKLEDQDLEGYAMELGLNMAKFKAALKDPALSAKIKADQALVTKMGARGTPGFFINGRLMSGARPFNQFKEVIDEELKAVEELRKSGAAGERVYEHLMKTALTEGKARPSAARARRPQPDPKAIYKVTLRGDEAQKGPDDALITIIEWSDFQCPFCKRVAPTLDALRDKYGKDLRVVFKHNPLPFHRNAPHAAAAAEAAKQQGKFWEMHDLLFANIRKLDPESVRTYAQQLDLDMAAFDHFLSNAAAKDLIAQDQALATKLGARGTPAFFINGRNLRGAQPQASFEAVIDEELKRAKAALKAGAKRKGLYEALIKDGAEKPVLIGGDAGAKPPAAAAAAPEPAKGQRLPWQVGPADPSKGPKDAKVTILEWIDYQCPFCNRVQATMAEVEAAYPKDVRVVVKQLPLPFHKDAVPAAKAALAAHEQGKFWEMHALLFKNQRALTRPDLTAYARQLNLDIPRFDRAVDGTRFDKWLAADKQQAEAAGLRGTPNFLINGLKFTGAKPFASFKATIDAELAAAAKK